MSNPLPKLLRRSVDLGEGESLDIVEVIGTQPGPVLALLGGVHGDEDEGVLAVRRVVQALAGRSFKGTVRCVPVCNPPAFRARMRFSPVDGKNMARVFPGNAAGTVTERAAHVISTQVIAGADTLIDLHSSGVNYAMPLFCGYFELDNQYSRKAFEYARAFGAPIVWAHTEPTQGRTISTALELGVPAIYAEALGGGEVRTVDVETYVGGVLNVLRVMGALEDELQRLPPQRLITDPGGNFEDSIPAPVAGYVVTYVVAGDSVRRGDRLVDIYDEEGHVVASIDAESDGMVMCLRRTARVVQGDIIAMVTRPATALALEPR